jgi:hypothetical protein
LKNQDSWKPTKFRIIKGQLRSSKDINEVGRSSRLLVDLIARFYSETIPLFAKGKLAPI